MDGQIVDFKNHQRKNVHLWRSSAGDPYCAFSAKQISWQWWELTKQTTSRCLNAHVYARVYACVCLTPRCKITTWLTGEQVAIASMKIVFSWAPLLRAGNATHVIVMECVQSFILILGTPGGGVGWALWGKRGSLGSHWLPISQLGLSASRLGSHLSLHLSSFPPHKSHTLNSLFWIHKWCIEIHWLCWYYET